MRKPLILSTIKEYNKKRPLRFHMPGHKGKIAKDFSGADCDITELSFADSLNYPSSIFKKAEETVSTILKSKLSKFTTDGSTSAIYTMLYAVKDLGEKIIIPKNAHQSVYNGVELASLTPIVLDSGFSDGVPKVPSVEEVLSVLDNNESVIGALLTYPDYYGRTFDIKTLKQEFDKRNKLLLIDGAHGGHLRFSNLFVYHGDYSSMWVDGVHKTLPCLTQTAILSVNDERLVESVNGCVNKFRTTSPSFILSSSIEYGVYYMEEKGERLISALYNQIIGLKQRLKNYGVEFLQTDDFLKLSLDLKSINTDSRFAEDFFETQNIFCEMNDGRYILFYLSPLTEKVELLKLEKAIIKLIKLERNGYEEKVKKTFLPTIEYSYIQAKSKLYEEVDLANSEGRTVYENFGVFPPCYPLCIAGEKIDKDILDYALSQKSLFGVNGGKIKVIKK